MSTFKHSALKHGNLEMSGEGLKFKNLFGEASVLFRCYCVKLTGVGIVGRTSERNGRDRWGLGLMKRDCMDQW